MKGQRITSVGRMDPLGIMSGADDVFSFESKRWSDRLVVILTLMPIKLLSTASININALQDYQH